jgi:hypothetical protein
MLSGSPTSLSPSNAPAAATKIDIITGIGIVQLSYCATRNR